MAISLDDKHLAVAGMKRDLKLFDVATGRLIRGFDWPHVYPDRMAFSVDGRMLALANAGVGNEHLAVWDVNSGKLLHSHSGNSGWGVYGMAFSLDGHLPLAKGSQSIAVWDTSTWKCLNDAYPSHDSFVDHVVFAGQGNEVVTEGSEGGIRLWERAHRSTENCVTL